MSRSLFTGDAICLAPIDREKDPEVEAAWTYDPAYLCALGVEPPHPLSAFQLKKRHEQLEKEADEKRNLYHFTLRTREGDRLIGFARLGGVDWFHGEGRLSIGIGAPEARGRGLGTQALALMLRFAFDELSLHRVSVGVPACYERTLRFYQRAGFQIEIRQREAHWQDGRRWDLLHLAILESDWRQAT